MNSKPYEGIKIVLAEPKSSLRKEYLEVLKDLGCRDIIETGNIKDVHAALEEGGIDMLIGDTTLPEGDLSEVVNQVRHSQIGDNPFIIAMVLVSESDKGLIKRVIDSGADDILMKPLDAAQLRARLLTFTSGRRPFVVTSDYIGPDRPTMENKGGIQIPQVKAPNPLLVRISGGRGSGVMKRAVGRAMNVVNEQKVERHADTIHWLMERLIAQQKSEVSASELNLPEQMQRLNDVAKDLANRLNGTNYQHAAEMCMTLEKMTFFMTETPDLAGQEEISLLGKLTNVIKRKCNANCIPQEVPQDALVEDNPAAIAPMADAMPA
ncbi:MAG: response regulator [Rhodospirillales bacterium]|nr:response regulator [Rhodospirillales bacterium]